MENISDWGMVLGVWLIAIMGMLMGMILISNFGIYRESELLRMRIIEHVPKTGELIWIEGIDKGKIVGAKK